jgi:hypothetical protein
MSHIGVAADTIQWFAIWRRGQHLIDDIRVTGDAVALCYMPVARFDLNRLMECFECEGKRMKKTIVGFRYVFSGNLMRQVAVDTHCYIVMAGFLPGIIIALHYMAVGACLRVAAQITESLGIAKGKNPHSRKHSQDYGKGNHKPSWHACHYI